MANDKQRILGMHVSYWAFIVVLVAVGYFYRKDLQKMFGGKKKPTGSDGNSTDATSQPSSGSSSSGGGGSSSGGTGSSGFTLNYAQIMELQRAINAFMYSKGRPQIAVDGVMGNQTRDALISASANPDIRSLGDYNGIINYLNNEASK